MSLILGSLFFCLFAPIYGEQLAEIIRETVRGNLTQLPGNLPQPKLVQQYGYDIESFDITTEDSYILKIFHVTKSPKCQGPKKQPPIILTHGLLHDSDVWFDAGPDASLGYLIPDECYDLWLPNVRGNYYGRRHVNLNPDTDSEFWDFSADEMGYYDIPAIIDFVLKKTGASKVNYIGIGQGSSTFFMMCDRRPEYCKKVNFKVSLAPLTRLLNTKSVYIRILTGFYNLARLVIESFGGGEAFPMGGLVQTPVAYICSNDAFYDLCQSLLILMDAGNPGKIDQSSTKQLFYHFPAGTSVKNLAKYGQAQYSETFDMFSYGPMGNMIKYGSLAPPAYNISATNIPIMVIYGDNDGIADKDDVEWVASQFPNKEELFCVCNPKWTHFDNTNSYLIPTGIYAKMRENLIKYST